MVDVAFYHLQNLALDKALPRLLEKTLESSKRALVLASSEDRVEALNGALWTYRQDSWLPHGSLKDGDPSDQPIWLAVSDENINSANFLFLTDGVSSSRLSEFERCFDLFDGNNPVMLVAARERWKEYKKAGHKLTYWQQTRNRGWEQTVGS